ncbi:MAG TPA: peptidase S10 [Sphingomonas sp.]|nr:peptidase S10 [Sphingomonas sp.]
MRARLGLAAALLAAVAGSAAAKPLPDCPSGAARAVQVAQVAGRPLHYRICAGTLPIRIDGEVRGRIFYTAYLAARTDRLKRPLAFVWNGGPGSDSRPLQFHALAPRTLRDGQLADNGASPLDTADLVFVDPVGTGFSRPVRPDYGKDFYGTNEDIASIAQFVRTFRDVYHRADAPLYLVGESFGTWRAAGVAETLIDQGAPVAGIALISGGIPLGETHDRALMRALSLPNRTATALALGKLAPELQAHPKKTLADAEAWARRVYDPALEHPQALSSADRKAVIEGLARYQGLPASTIDPETLWVSPRQFRTDLLKAGGETLNVFDMRKIGEDKPDPADDRAVIDFYRRTLGYTDGHYAGIEEKGPEVGSLWRYDQAPITPESLARAKAGEGPPSPSRPWTLRAMEREPALRVWVAAGMYDSLNSCAGNRATVAALPAGIAERFSLHCYAGGHMMYDDPAVAQPFGADLRRFLGGGR